MKSNLIGIRREEIPTASSYKPAAVGEASMDDWALDPHAEAERVPPKMRFDIRDAIYASWEDKREREEKPHRRYMGASDIGNECPRALYYTFYNAKKKHFDGRLLRLFNRGHREEPVIEEDFERIGVPISTAAAGGGQHAFSDDTKHYRVHLDGIVELEGKRYAIEMKTMSRFSFAKLDKMGGVRYSHPNYYAQMMSQIRTAEHSVQMDGAIFVAVCKDTDEIWVEEVDINKEVQDRTQLRSRAIIAGVVPPRLDSSPNAPPCKWCDYKEICRDHRLEQIEKNCRTCQFSQPMIGGTWSCKAGQPYGTVCFNWQLKAGFQT